jgi:hypothetical protein
LIHFTLQIFTFWRNFCQSEKQLFQLQWAHKHSLPAPVSKAMDIGIGQYLWLLLVSVRLKALSHNLELAGLSLKVLGK